MIHERNNSIEKEHRTSSLHKTS